VSGNKVLQGAADATTGTNDFKAMAFVAERILSRISTADLVVVKAVYAQGGGQATPGAIAPIGIVDVQPLVNQIDGFGNATPHGTVYSLAYFRLGGGPNATIIDPEVGDIGLANYAGRDISSVKANNGKPSNPGSRRAFDKADGIYQGTVLAKAPTQYITFTKDGDNRGVIIADANKNKITLDHNGIVVVDANNNKITMDKNGVIIADNNNNTFTMNNSGVTLKDDNGNTITMGSNGILLDGAKVTLAGDVITQAGVDLNTHIHSGVQTGSGDTGPPVP
jgi:hypothetical protein